jgi:flagellar L-ring protein precursor FlgH
LIHRRLLIVALFGICIAGADAHAQTGSLLHAPLTGNVVANGQRANLRSSARPPQLADTPANSVDGGSTVPLRPVNQFEDEPYLPDYGSHGDQPPPAMLNNVSWTYQPAPPVRTFQKNQVVTIRVDEITRMAAEGNAENRKQTLFRAILTDWVKLADLKLRPSAQPDGDPSIGTKSNSVYRAESNIESRESLAFNIAATVVDIRPNGNMVLEARKKIRVNDNLWETSLTGLCRAEDISPDNVVLSKDLIDLEIQKEDRGHLRDGYRRGWFQRWFDYVQPF